MTNKKEELPVSINTFKKSDFEYIELASKRIPYFVDPIKAEIHVPPDLIEEAKDNLFIRDIVTKYKFAVQATIGAEYLPNKEFNPIMHIKSQQKEVKAAGLTEIGVGFEFKDTRDYNKLKRIFSDKGKDWSILHVNDMRPNYFISKISLQIMLDNKLFTPIL